MVAAYTCWGAASSRCEFEASMGYVERPGKNAVLTKISDRLIRVLIKFLAVFLVSIDNATPNAYER